MAASTESRLTRDLMFEAVERQVSSCPRKSLPQLSIRRPVHLPTHAKARHTRPPSQLRTQVATVLLLLASQFRWPSQLASLVQPGVSWYRVRCPEETARTCSVLLREHARNLTDLGTAEGRSQLELLQGSGRAHRGGITSEIMDVPAPRAACKLFTARGESASAGPAYPAPPSPAASPEARLTQLLHLPHLDVLLREIEFLG